VLLSGKYEHTIDDKQRLAIPAEIRSRLDPKLHGEAFYVAPGPNGALWIWPEKVFERMAERIEQSLLPAEEMMEFDEATFPEARHLEMDKNGRVRLPEDMLTEAGLGAAVLILGMRDHLELRDPAQWDQSRQERQSRRREIMLRARKAMLTQRQEGSSEPNDGEKAGP
jgi:MraZ protein